MQFNQILSKQVTVIKTANGYENNDWGHGSPVGMIIPLKHVLYDMQELLKEKVKNVRSLPYHSKEQYDAKQLMPRYYICGVFDLNEYKVGRFPIHDYPNVPSDLMTIDIDEKDNPNIDIWKIREEIFKLPYVFCCLKSISGHGFYCIIPIEDTHYTKEYYHYILRLWKQKYNINIDDNADTIIRARIVSYDEDIDKWVKNEDIQVWNLKYIERKEEIAVKQQEKTYPKYERKTDGLDWNAITNKAMELLINDGYTVNNYYGWYHLGCELSNFENGYELFHKASMNYDNNQKDAAIMKRWKGCKPTGIDSSLIQKWCGMAKNKYGEKWFKKYINKQYEETTTTT